MDYYKLLEVDKQATKQQIKKAFRKLALKWHPDKHQDAKKKLIAESKFKEIGEAYAVLSNTEKRKMYDNSLLVNSNHSNCYRHNYQFTNIDIEKILEDFFMDADDEFRNEFLEYSNHPFARIFREKGIWNSIQYQRKQMKDSIIQKPFKFHSKKVYFCQILGNENIKSDNGLSFHSIRYPFEKNNREYGREILEIIRCLLERLPILQLLQRTNNLSNCCTCGGISSKEEYFLLKSVKDCTNYYVFDKECIDLAVRLYNLRDHLAHWQRKNKTMSYKSIDHYMNVCMQFFVQLEKQPQFAFLEYRNIFKCAKLNIDILHEQFIAHKSKDRIMREKYGNIRKSLDTAYLEYEHKLRNRILWYTGGIISVVAVLAFIIYKIELPENVNSKE